VKVKIIILSIYIKRYHDYRNEYSINEIMDIKDKYINECVEQENKYKIFMRKSFRGNDLVSKCTNSIDFTDDELDIFCPPIYEYLYYYGKNTNE